MRIAITGADGFIGKNLSVRLRELGHKDLATVVRGTPPDALQEALAGADCVFHLAGVNRVQNPADFASGNTQLTQTVCDILAAAGRKARLVLTSSTQALQANPYGLSKQGAEQAAQAYAAATGAPVCVLRLPNIFGKWCRPNYNSVVATFCHNMARGLPIQIHNPAAALTLAHVDDVVEKFIRLLHDTDAKDWQALPASRGGEPTFATLAPQYTTTVGEVAQLIEAFRHSRHTLLTERVGTGLVRALYATYVSYLPVESFAYSLPQHGDKRGVFVEMLKTPDCGQFSYFTAPPGVTRGGHYHHSKTEKFLVIKGTAHFGFRQIVTGETHAIVTRGGEAKIVETVPGWTHNITNVGEEEMIVMLWANEVYDRARPDTVACRV